ncbi:hypothetical protein CK203_039715 [Vitis vinifera]|uniref:Uncharacterized protein n=1 Tax=Vitis vinifera TaxID=29760 RepID=A0A438HTT5_VITVI|nr:hypothetical protein CK203_039715 [Vitis vinifera]
MEDVGGCRDNYYSTIGEDCLISTTRGIAKHSGKGKISHLMGTGLKPGDPRFEAWDEEDSMIMAWLRNSMTPEMRHIVYDFLVGLNPEFDQVRIQILGKQEIPCFNEVVALIRGEESRSSVMLEPQTLDGSALVAKTEYSEQRKNDLPKHLGRDNQWKENKDNL